MPAKLARVAAPAHPPKKHPARKQQHDDERRATSSARAAQSPPRASQSTPNSAKKRDDHQLLEKRFFPRQVLLHAQMGHQLRELWLTNHRIGVLPPEIVHCGASLRVLGLGGNAISSLPDELGSLTGLEALYLEKNRIATISADSQFPPKLRDLRLDGNLLTAFPLPVTCLRLLSRLGLSHNQISKVPCEIRRLLNLVELDLDFNCIRSEGLPQQEMATLKNLARLGLERNHLDESALDRLQCMPALVVLRLNGNRSTSDGESGDLESVPVRHDGYFQTTQSSHVPSDLAEDSTLPTSSEDDVRTRSRHDGSSLHARLLECVVPCRVQNLLNAEFYRSGLASGALRKRGAMCNPDD